MGKVIMGAIVSLDGFMADGESRTTQASADFMLDLYGDMAANAIVQGDRVTHLVYDVRR